MKIPANRRGFACLSQSKKTTISTLDAKEAFEAECKRLENSRTPFVIWNSKLSHSGVVSYKSFENCYRSVKTSSLANLLNTEHFTNYILHTLVKEYKCCKSDDERCRKNDEAIDLLDNADYELFLKHTHQARMLNAAQSRKIARLSQKLAYYTQKRVFKSKKSGVYSMRVAFLTLTAPDSANPTAVNLAFNHFLDYLQRTANCVYVWKKELGEKSGNLHYHIIVNNFIPYYIVSWKWKRLLLAQGVQWTINEDGSESNSHSRIELPRNRRQTAHYIAKYLSKAYALPGQYGYISGHSSVLDELKEYVVSEGDFNLDELRALNASHRVIRRDHVSITCCDLLHVADIAPDLAAMFEDQYKIFSEKITLPQKFHEV